MVLCHLLTLHQSLTQIIVKIKSDTIKVKVTIKNGYSDLNKKCYTNEFLRLRDSCIRHV